MHGYVDEVADAGCDVLLLCSNLYRLPGWDSDHYPYWREEGRSLQFPDTVLGKVLSRARDFITAGNDLIQLSLDRALRFHQGMHIAFGSELDGSAERPSGVRNKPACDATGTPCIS